jgi:hypothetical protein
LILGFICKLLSRLWTFEFESSDVLQVMHHFVH